MSISWCPYCNSVKSLLLGNVYCSRQAAAMTKLDTGTLFIRAKALEETDDHISRLSIRCMLRGEQRYRVGGNEHLVHPDNYLLVNQGQHYRTSFHGEEESEMILVAFRPGLAEELLYSLESSTEHLLDHPFGSSATPGFFEQTYPRDPFIGALFQQLRGLFDAPESLKTSFDTSTVYEQLLQRLFVLQRYVRLDSDRLRCSRASTRTELYRRLHIARDYLDANLAGAVKLEDAAGAACLSVHHFKRAFRDLFGITPHRYLVNRRIGKARELLLHGQHSVAEVCGAVGFENTSSFIRLFREKTGQTPGSLQ